MVNGQFQDDQGCYTEKPVSKRNKIKTSPNMTFKMNSRVLTSAFLVFAHSSTELLFRNIVIYMQQHRALHFEAFQNC